MAEQHASITVKAPLHQVYELFTHFNDFPKFMSFVKEVTYYDSQRSHWVAHVLNDYEWDAVNEDWIPDQQIGWRSTSGLENTGRVKFQSLSPNRTVVDVYVNYTPPASILGAAAERLGVDNHFDNVLQSDLNRFAKMVDEAPLGALDPMQSNYLFNNESAVSKGQATSQQKQAMANDPMMSRNALRERNDTLEQQTAQQRQQQDEWEQQRQRFLAQQHAAAEQQQSALQHQAEVDRQTVQEQEARAARQRQNPHVPDPVYDTIGGRNASMPPTVLGDQDAQTERFPTHTEDPMLGRAPIQENVPNEAVVHTEEESPWSNAIHAKPTRSDKERREQEDQQEDQ